MPSNLAIIIKSFKDYMCVFYEALASARFNKVNPNVIQLHKIYAYEGY